MVDKLKALASEGGKNLTEDQAIKIVIDKLWPNYDVDKSGSLSKQETQQFVLDTLG